MRIFNINSIPEDLLPIVGGKARGLFYLNKYGFKVPTAFIVMDLETEEDFELAADEFEKSGLKKVAVRSSATLEDGKDFSSAGQFATILDVEGREKFISALKECQDSLKNVNAVTYSKIFLKNTESKMTIVVQEMVDADKAGVIFTKNPADGKSTLIEAVKGLGEQLVSSKVSAEQYIYFEGKFNRDNRVILSDNDVKNLGEGALKAEASFGMPMDLEWAIKEDGEINWLQARPITVHEEVTINELDVNFDVDQCVLTTNNIGEVLPGAVTPLTLSTNIYALDYGIRQMIHKIGCTKKLDDLPPYSVLSNYYNTMFFNLTNIYKIVHSCYLASKESLELSICGRSLDDLPDINKENAKPIKRLFNTFTFLSYAMNCKKAIKGMDKVVEKIPALFDFSKSPAELYKQCIDNFQVLNDAMFYHYCTSWYSGSQCNMLITIEEKNFDSRDTLQALMAGALTKINDIESAQILICMKKLAKVLCASKPEIINYDVDQLTDYLNNLKGADKTALDVFMKRHGHRGIREFEFRSLTWNDDMRIFANSLKSVLAHKDEEQNKLEKSWEEYADEILSKDGKFAKKTLRSFILKARKGVYYREYTKSRCVYVGDFFKRAFRKIAKDLVKENILPEEDLIYFLRKEEIGDLINGKSSLIKTAIARRRLFNEQSELKFKDVFVGKPVPLKPIVVDKSVSEYTGTPVSRGIATGRAHIVRTIDDANKLKPGEIMVAEITDIGWSPYYCTIGGLVTEIGSSLSHGVVVAREYSLPTVVNVNGALTIIKDGDLIKIDGNEGKVYILER